MQFSKNRILSALALPTAILAFASAAHADYSSDPGLPASFLATGFDDVQPKVVAAPDGGHYVSCLTGSGYDVAVMRVDRNGRATGIHTEAAFGNVEPGARGLQLAATFGL